MTLSLATYSILQCCFQKKVEILFNKYNDVMICQHVKCRDIVFTF